MLVHQQKRKVTVVMDVEELMAMGICLSESPVLKNKMLALKLKNAVDESTRNQELKK